MKKTYLSLIALALILSAATFGGFGTIDIAKADTTTTAVASSPSCLSLSYNIGIGTSSPDVYSLQAFLNSRGFMSYTPTGYFGPITYASVVRLQASYGIPNTGFVGPLTRAEILSLSCGSTPVVTPGGVVISSITPNAAVGGSVTITGSGFTGDNTVFFAGGALQHVPLDPIENLSAIVCTTAPNCALPVERITFTVPSAIGPYCAAGMACPMYVRLLTPGTYPLYVTNANGTSNTVDLNIGTTGTSTPLSITGVDAPNSLPVGTTGTWTVHATTSTSGTLHYSVNWGDQAALGTSNFAVPSSAPLQSSATFTHAYSYAGTFDPSFTVTDDYGHSVTSSASVLVTPLY